LVWVTDVALQTLQNSIHIHNVPSENCTLHSLYDDIIFNATKRMIADTR